MKVAHDIATDTLTVVLRDAAVAESDESRPGVVLDYDDGGRLVAIEILHYSTFAAGDVPPELPLDFWREPTLADLAAEAREGDASYDALAGAGAELWSSDAEFEAFQRELADARTERRSGTG
jgi:uncharacterized protein YuzE